ncbi:uncharacterized protein LOC115887084 [Sitophilus oryzae]|uniref:Uncharacterized protein LOC115887084 n=1 Tax=Sitophilus oryzae TaxID=7048 RepID=A0A6J2YEE1_SITOR|nr:uncharacterized protein LOC115887084 [Sitophilus oryzae]
MFSDESRFCLRTDRRVWRLRNTRLNDRYVQEGHPFGVGGVMVWGGIFYGDRTECLWRYNDSNIDKDNILKINYILLSIMVENLNGTHFPYFFDNYGLEFDEKTKMYENNSMLGNIQRRKADIAGKNQIIDNLVKENWEKGYNGFVEYNRLLFMRFFAPTTPDYIAFLLRAPPLSYLQNVYLMPFDCLSWYGIGITFFAGIIILSAIIIEERRFINNRADSSIIDIFMLLLSALLQKFWNLEFKSLSGRIATAIFYLCFMVIFTFYCACIILFLQKSSESIKTFSDIYYSGFDFGVQDVSYNYFYFLKPNERTDENWRQIIYKERISKDLHKFFMSAEEGMENVRKGFFAFQIQGSIGHHIIQKTYTNQEKCSVRVAPSVYYFPKNVYLAIHKNSVYIDHYKVGFQRLFENGLQKRALLRLFVKKPKCEEHMSNFSGIGITETKFIFTVFLIGIGASLSILLLEIFIFKITDSLMYYKMLKKYHVLQSYTN